MKTKILLLAVTALTFVACSSDETTAVNQNDVNAITFRPFVGGTTRTLTDVTTTSMQTSGFYAAAYNHSDNSVYFAADLFNQYTSSGDTYKATKTYYWPATGSLDFIAYYPNVGGQLTQSAWNRFTLSPADEVSTHNDYVVAASLEQSKPNTSSGVPLHFKHLGAQIILKVYNSKGTANGNMKVTVTGWKVGYLSKSGTYTFSTSTATATAITAPTIVENSQKTGNVPNSYSQTVTSTTYSGDSYDAQTEAVQVGVPIVVVPQTTSTFTSTSTYATGGYLPGTFIGVCLKIEDLASPAHTIADATSNGVWAVWPVTNTWVAGTKYTYTIDLSQGGYKEKDTEGETLKTWLSGAEIFFSSVDVTEWGSPTNTDVSM